MAKKKFLNQSQFGRLVNRGRAAISSAIKRGDVFRVKDKGIDPDHPVNKAYAEQAALNSGNKREVELAKAAGARLADPAVLDEILNLLKDKNGQNTAAESHESPVDQANDNTQPNEAAPKNTSSGYSNDDLGAFAGEKRQKAELARANAAKANLMVAKEMKILVPQKKVLEWWNRVVGVLRNSILNIDEKLAEEVAAICGVTDPVIVGKVRRRIGDEAVSSLTLVQEAGSSFSFSD